MDWFWIIFGILVILAIVATGWSISETESKSKWIHEKIDMECTVLAVDDADRPDTFLCDGKKYSWEGRR